MHSLHHRPCIHRLGFMYLRVICCLNLHVQTLYLCPTMFTHTHTSRKTPTFVHLPPWLLALASLKGVKNMNRQQDSIHKPKVIHPLRAKLICSNVCNVVSMMTFENLKKLFTVHPKNISIYHQHHHHHHHHDLQHQHHDHHHWTFKV